MDRPKVNGVLPSGGGNGEGDSLLAAQATGVAVNTTSVPPAPIGIGSTGSTPPLPDSLKDLLSLRYKVDTILHSPAFEAELEDAVQGPETETVKLALQELVQSAEQWKMQVPAGRKVTAEEDARGKFILAWALGRVGEFDGTTPADLPKCLEKALEVYAEAAALLHLSVPPLLDQVPSATRPSKTTLPLSLVKQSVWIGDFLGEWARTQTTLAFSKLLLHNAVIAEEDLADLLELSCRRNVQALFTPIDPNSPSDDVNPHEAATVMGNANLIKDMSTMYPWSANPPIWSRRLGWATHVADVKFVEASMSATRLLEAAATAASILRSSSTSEGKRSEVREVLEAIIAKLVPIQKAQGRCLLDLGEVMLQAIEVLYLGRDGTDPIEKRKRDRSMDSSLEESFTTSGFDIPVPENELVRETRAVLVRAASLLEDAYASFRRSPVNIRTSQEELKILRRLETTYVCLEELDNETPEVVQLKADRVNRALWINDRLLELGDADDDEDSETEQEITRDAGDTHFFKGGLRM